MSVFILSILFLQKIFFSKYEFILNILFRKSLNTNLILYYNDFNLEMGLFIYTFFYYCLALILFRSFLSKLNF